MNKKKIKSKSDKKNSKVGRPKIEIDWEEFDKLCFMQCTLAEIAGWFDVSEDTIERRVKEEKGLTFAEYNKIRSSKGKMSIRRKQFEVAMTGNVGMLIWLGKQYLGQKDKKDIELPDDWKIKITFDGKEIK